MKASLFLLLAQATGLTFHTEDATRPTTKVVKLLQGMQEQLESEAKADEETYDKFKCWCHDNTVAKEKAVKEAKLATTELQDRVEILLSKSQRLKAEVEKTEDEVAKNQAALDTATALREQQNKEYVDDLERLDANLQGVNTAQTALSPAEGTAFLQSREGAAKPLQTILAKHSQKMSAEDKDTFEALASEADARFAGQGVIFITCGQQGIQEAFAKGCGDGTLVRNLLVQGEPSHYRAGQDIVVARDADSVKKLFLEVGDVYITVEGGPGVAQDARMVMARSAHVLALKRTGGASAGKFDFPEKALRPDFASEEQWDLLCSSATPVRKAAGIAVDLLNNLLEAKGRPSMFCGASARCAAKVLLWTSIPLSIIFIGDALLSAVGKSFLGGGGGGVNSALMAYMGLMCLAESYKIYRLYVEERLYTHPLFELARSDTSRVVDRNGASTRLNTSERDDPEAANPQVQFSEIRAFAGQGRSLNQAPPSSTPYQNMGMPAESRQAWLKRMEEDQAQRGKTVRELEDDRLMQKR